MIELLGSETTFAGSEEEWRERGILLPRLYTAEELVYAGVFVSVPAAAIMRHRGTGPAYVKMGGAKNSRIVYREADVIEWLDKMTVKPAYMK